MRSTFHGLEVAKRGLYAQQSAISTTGHNIANANTEGYSRQRVNLEASRPIEVPSMTKSTYPGQLGTGVELESIKRLRDQFLDLQYRRENQSQGEWSVREKTNMTIEGIINEPSESGLRSVMDKFWNSWEALNRDPSLLSARSSVRAEAINLIDTFKHIGSSLQTLSEDLKNNIDIKTEEANGIIQSIADLNKNIKKIEALGDNANDLRDKRDLLVDKLSTIVDVNVVQTPNSYSIISAGVEVINNDQATLLSPDNAANATSGEIAGFRKSLELDVEVTKNQVNSMVNTLVTGKVTTTLPAGYVAARDITTQSEVTLEDGTVIEEGGTIPEGAKIATKALVEVDGFNGLHQLGYSLSEPTESDIPFFVTADGSDTFTINNMNVNPDILANTDNIAASGQYEEVTNADGSTTRRVIRGNSDIANGLAGLKDKVFTFPAELTSLSSGTIDDYFRAMTGELGIRSYEATRNKMNQKDLVDAIDTRRQSVSGVSMDEEMANLIKYQHAYSAAARTITAVDEMLDQVINRMGLVGR